MSAACGTAGVVSSVMVVAWDYSPLKNADTLTLHMRYDATLQDNQQRRPGCSASGTVSATVCQLPTSGNMRAARYDAVAVDIFQADLAADYLLSSEFFADLRRCLNPGMLFLN